MTRLIAPGVPLCALAVGNHIPPDSCFLGNSCGFYGNRFQCAVSSGWAGL